jgi:hypothetical protein
MRASTTPLHPLRDRRGVALPLALIGLIILSVLITATVVTSSNQISASGAQQDATTSLYVADQGLNMYLAEMADSIAVNPTGTAWPSTGTRTYNGSNVSVSRTLVQYVSPVFVNNRVQTPGWAVHAITSTDLTRGGRQVGAYMRVNLDSGFLQMDINGAGSFGGVVVVGGNAGIYGQVQDANECSNNTQVPAVEISAEGSIQTNGTPVLQGGVRQTTETREEFRDRILGTFPIRDLATTAQIKFGPLLNPDRNWSRSYQPNSSNSRTNPATSFLNWGCPVNLGVDCSGTNADTAYYPIVAIDANGGEVDLQGDHGQGILIVINGNMKISGQFQYKGIILIEGALDITGTVDVEGAVIGLNTITVGNRNDMTNNETGTLRITYDPCAINRAQEAYNVTSPRRTMGKPAYGWFEVVR